MGGGGGSPPTSYVPAFNATVTAFGASSIMNIVPSQISRFTDISDELKFSLFITTIIVLTIYLLLLMAT